MKKDLNNLASNMKQRITFQVEVQEVDDGGGYGLTWSDGSTVWAEIVSVANRSISSEKFRAGQLEDKKVIVFRIRYLSGITAKMRIKYDNRFFNIRSVNNIDEKNEIIEILAEEGMAN